MAENKLNTPVSMEWKLLGSGKLGTAVSVNPQEFDDVLLTVFPFGVSNPSYVMSSIVNAKLFFDGFYALGFGGTLNTTTPNGCKALIGTHHINMYQYEFTLVSGEFDGEPFSRADVAEMYVYTR